MPSKQTIGQVTMYNGITSSFKVRVLTAHNTLNGIRSHHISTSLYAKMPCSTTLILVNYYTKSLTSAMHGTCTSQVQCKVGPGWVLILVNFDPIQGIGSKVGSERSFMSAHSFMTLRYICSVHVKHTVMTWKASLKLVYRPGLA